MRGSASGGALRVKAFAKINLALRVLARRVDGYHELRTTFQSLAIHDTLTVTPAAGAFGVVCDDPGCPTDRGNLVWRAAELVWRMAGRRGAPHGARVALRKRIPMAAGLGGGSSDAAAALRALSALWAPESTVADWRTLAATLGADVPYFLEGGTALGVARGDIVYPLPDLPRCWVVVVMPGFGVATAAAYRWFDEAESASARRPAGIAALSLIEVGNDLQAPVAARHRGIAALVRRLERAGASYAAMSGSGSAVFGLFPAPGAAREAAARLAGGRVRAVVTTFLGRRAYARAAAVRVLPAESAIV